MDRLSYVHIGTVWAVKPPETCAFNTWQRLVCVAQDGMPAQLDYHTIYEMFRRFRDHEPEPKGELDHVNAYTLVVAVALSAQATDVGVNKATKELFKIADTPEKMLALGLDGVTQHIKTIGLFRQKAKNVMKMSQILVDEYDSIVPSSRAALESLPGVGRKTANVVLNMWFKQPTQAVDTHILRFGNRTGVAKGKDVVAVERAIEDHIPAEFQHHAHHWMILHGRYTCKARKPVCANCIIEDLCQFEEKTND
jgi:endonuclease-3